jgi:hypothetical protein
MSRGLPLGGKVLVPSMMSACIQKLLDEPDLETPIAYIRLAVDAPVDVRGALLSVALEALTGHLKAKGLIAAYPSPLTEEPWIALEKDLRGVLDAHALTWDEKRRDDTKRVFSRAIDRFNQPTNRAKLTAPFTALGIEPSEAQAEAIDTRNRLLHSGRFMLAAKREETSEAWRAGYLMEMHLLTALNKLLLKYLGYRGPVYDWGEAGFDRVAESCFTEV